MKPKFSIGDKVRLATSKNTKENIWSIESITYDAHGVDYTVNETDFLYAEDELVRVIDKPLKVVPTIKRILFVGDKTVVLWSDNTRTVSKRSPGDVYDRHVGVAMAIAKKVIGNTFKFDKFVRDAGTEIVPPARNVALGA